MRRQRVPVPHGGASREWEFSADGRAGLAKDALHAKDCFAPITSATSGASSFGAADHAGATWSWMKSIE